MNRFKIAQYIALGATAFSVLGFYLGVIKGYDIALILMCIGFIGGLVSYLFGGLGKAFSMAGKIAFWGWVAVPFPYDILTFLLSFIFAIFVFIFLPIIPVRKAYKENM